MTTTGTTVQLRTHRGLGYIDTLAVCPPCGQHITVVLDSTIYTECGGMDEGGCNAWIDGDQRAEEMHEAAIAAVQVWGGDQGQGTTSCVCQVLPDRIVQPVGECPWHGDEEQATAQAFGEDDEEEWVHPM